MVGDTTWDVIAARRADVKTIAVESGGFSESELRAAGAVDVFPSVAELIDGLDRTPAALTRPLATRSLTRPDRRRRAAGAGAER